MTVYELAKSIPVDQLEQLSSFGLVNRSVSRQIYIFERYLDFVRKGCTRMQAYTEVSELCYTSEDNVRKIIQKFCKEIE